MHAVWRKELWRNLPSLKFLQANLAELRSIFQVPERMALCESCQSLNLAEVFALSISPNPSTLPQGWVHSETYSALRDNAAWCSLCSILAGAIPVGDASLVQESDCVRLQTFTRERWPRVEAARRVPAPVSGLEVKFGPKDGNLVHAIRHLPLWVEEGQFPTPNDSKDRGLFFADDNDHDKVVPRC